MKKVYRIALLLILVLCIFAGCSKKTGVVTITGESAVSEASVKTEDSVNKQEKTVEPEKKNENEQKNESVAEEPDLVQKFSYYMGAGVFCSYLEEYNIDSNNFIQGINDIKKGVFSMSDEEIEKIVNNFNAYITDGTVPEGSTAEAVINVFSYFAGANVFYVYANAYGVEYSYFVKGITDIISGSFSMTEEEIEKVLNDYSSYYNEVVGKANLEYAESFLAENKNNEGVVTTDSGLQYKITEVGTGSSVGKDATVSVYYTLILPNGTVADQCVSPSEPASFSLNGVVPGFAEACTVAPVGSKLTAWIHPDLGYGQNGASPVIEPNMLLQFEIEIVSAE